tara:strand:- start:484 stop:2388 length:1905 start_codon:yes stop_codon:yes gene_type:complete
MALVVADRVKETTTSTGTGAISLAGAEPNFRTFSSVLSDGDTTYYAIIDDTNTAFEVGLGTYASGGNTITRTTVLSSSNSNNAVSFSAGSKDVLLTYPADKSAYLDGSNQLVINDTAVTSTAAELNLLDGATANTVVNSKAVIYGSSGQIAATSYTGDGSALTGIDSSPTLTATASGAIANGDTIIVNSNGTVSAISGTTEAVGSETVFESASINMGGIAYDANANKVVIVYGDQGNSSYGTAVVGTVSGTSISFGTPVVFQSASTGLGTADVVYDPDTNKVVVANKASQQAFVGTISGTTISFGSGATFEAGAVSNTVKMCYDTANDKVVITYADSDNSAYGTAVVGTVSGTSISFGTPVVFKSGGLNKAVPSYDTNAGKLLIGYQASGDVFGIVGTVSGTSISFGSENTLESSTSEFLGVDYDPTAQKHMIFFSVSGGVSAAVATISGTSVSYGSKTVVYSGSTANNERSNVVFDATAGKFVAGLSVYTPSFGAYLVTAQINGTSVSAVTSAFDFNSSGAVYGMDLAYDSSAGKVILAYRDNANSEYGTGAVYTTPATNITSSNYIGISNGAYSDTATATIQLIGSVDDAQSGLTAGQAYYVQNDGSLSTTEGSPSVFAGTAVSATKIIVKG